MKWLSNILKLVDVIITEIVYRFVMIFVGVSGILASMYFSYKWFLDYIKNPFLAGLLSIANVGAINVLYSVKEVIKTQYNWKKSFSFTVAWIIAIFISIFSTIETLYKNLYSTIYTYEINKIVETNKKDMLGEIERQINTLQEEIRLFYNITNKRELQAWERTLIIKKQTAIQNLLEEKKNLLKTDVEEKRANSIQTGIEKSVVNIYAFLTKIFNGFFTAEQIQFFIYLLPAIFIDFIAPKLLYVALYLNNIFIYNSKIEEKIGVKFTERKKQEKKNKQQSITVIAESKSVDEQKTWKDINKIDATALRLLKRGEEYIKDKLWQIYNLDEDGILFKKKVLSIFNKNWEYWAFRKLLVFIGAWQDINDNSFTLSIPFEDALNKIFSLTKENIQGE